MEFFVQPDVNHATPSARMQNKRNAIGGAIERETQLAGFILKRPFEVATKERKERKEREF